jgi:hypothetical protein
MFRHLSKSTPRSRFIYTKHRCVWRILGTPFVGPTGCWECKCGDSLALQQGKGAARTWVSDYGVQWACLKGLSASAPKGLEPISYSILIYYILFQFILFYSILFYSILFYSTPLYSLLTYSSLIYSILFYSILFSSNLFQFNLLHSNLLYSILFNFILFYSIIFSSNLFQFNLFNSTYSTLLYSILFPTDVVISLLLRIHNGTAYLDLYRIIFVTM